MLDPKTLKAITQRVQKQFPEMAESKPNVKVQHPPQAKNPSAAQEPAPVYLITYQATVTSPDGKSIPRLVRVMVNADGKILKITTSR